MHKILERQLRRYLKDIDEPMAAELTKLYEAISNTYDHYDQDYRLLERSLEISSKELGENNERLKKEIERVRNSKAENQELERMNKFMIGRELRMKELKEQIEVLEQQVKELTKNQPESADWTNKDALSQYAAAINEQ